MTWERALQLAAGFFAVASYAVTLYLSAIGKRTILPYAVLIGLHGLIALWLLGQETGGSDAAGNGLAKGLVWLSWLASSVVLGCVTWCSSWRGFSAVEAPRFT